MLDRTPEAINYINIPLSEKTYIDLVKRYPACFPLMFYHSYDICNELVKHGTKVAEEYLPKTKFIDTKVVQLMVDHAPNIIFKFPTLLNKLNEEYLIKAVSINGNFIKYINKDKQTLRLCETVTQENPQMVKYCNHLTIKMLEYIIVNEPEALCRVTTMPTIMVKRLLQKHPTIFVYIKHLMDINTMRWFAQINPRMVATHCMDNMLTDDICDIILQQDPTLIDRIGLEGRILNRNTLNNMIKTHPTLLPELPAHMIDEELCILAMCHTGDIDVFKVCMKYIREDTFMDCILRSDAEIISEWFRESVHHISREKINQLIEKNPYAIVAIDNPYIISEDVIIKCLKNKPEILALISKPKIEWVIIALNNGFPPKLYHKLPEEFLKNKYHLAKIKWTTSIDLTQIEMSVEDLINSIDVSGG